MDKLDARLGTPPVAGAAKGAARADRSTPRASRAPVASTSLTRARRAAGPTTRRRDALLSELSASGGWDPARDERGVVVTLRGAFQGTKLTDDGEAKLESLGRVAAAHPGFGVQVVVHDAQPPAAKDESDARRADATVKALVTGGAAAATREGRARGRPRSRPSTRATPGCAPATSGIDVVFVASGELSVGRSTSSS